MKIKKYISFAILAIATVCSSCTDFLEESDPNKIPSETYYSTENDIQYAANGAYVALRATGYYKNMWIFILICVPKAPRFRIREEVMVLITSFTTTHS